MIEGFCFFSSTGSSIIVMNKTYTTNQCLRRMDVSSVRREIKRIGNDQAIQDARTTTTTRTSTHSYSIRPAWCSRVIVARCAYGQNHALRNRSFGTVLEDVPIEVCCRRTVDDGVVLLFIGRLRPASRDGRSDRPTTVSWTSRPMQSQSGTDREEKRTRCCLSVFVEPPRPASTKQIRPWHPPPPTTPPSSGMIPTKTAAAARTRMSSPMLPRLLLRRQLAVRLTKRTLPTISPCSGMTTKTTRRRMENSMGGMTLSVGRPVKIPPLVPMPCVNIMGR